ncbi:MAG TPA: hypothetical protein VFL42_12135, partial [Terriglobales bacterium]|nr:hypothetical protein [Terriglobales bacterium]
MRVLVSTLVFALLLVLIETFPAQAQAARTSAPQSHAADIAGDWQGTIDAGVAQLHVVLHISKAADGSYTATLDSLDQGAHGIPITSIALKNSKLTFESAPIHGTYEGKVSADAGQIEGTWSQGQPLPLNFRRAAKPSDIDGAWLGTLESGGAKLRLLFHITTTPAGLNATLDSLDQGARAIPANGIRREGQDLRIEFKQINGVFTGALNRELTAIEGTWTQGTPLPLILKKASEKDLAGALAPPKRPQDPVKPYPYRELEVSYENKSASGVTLAATLTLPQGPGPFPAVLLITGSGQQDRNEELLGHRPFLVLADYLTRRGIAVLRADDRGFAKSTGNFAA